MERRGVSRSAPYGQACMSCFKMKCKCVIRLDGDGCERCHRLKKQCYPSNALRRQTTDMKQNSNERISKLEGRLDDLVSLLQSRKVLDGDTSVQPQHISHAEQPEPLITTPILSLDAAGNNDTNTRGPPPLMTSSPMPLPMPRLPSSPRSRANAAPLEPSASSASACLKTFRSRMLRHFPFVYLPAHLTAQQLRRDRPFLFCAIICIMSPSAREKRARAGELKRVLYEMCFLQQQRPQHENQSGSTDQSMDLLLGLLTYIAWGWDHVLSRCSLSRLMMVAISLVGEMRLDKSVPQDLHTMGLFTPGFEGWYGEASGEVTAQFFLERQRAVLGCFVLSSVVSAYFTQVDAMRWTPQMDEALAAISNNEECPTDAALALQVRLTLLATKAIQIRDQQQQQQTDQAQTATLAAPALSFIKELLGKLQELRVSQSPALQQRQEVLLAHTHYTELCIIETVRAAHPIAPPVGTPITACVGPLSPGPNRLSCFWQSVLAIDACTSALLTLSPSDFLGVSFIQWAQLARCVLVLNNLIALEDPGWNRAAVRALIDLPVLLGRMAEKLELAAAEAGEQESDDVFTQLACGMRMFCSGIQGGEVEPEHGGAREDMVDSGGAGDDVVAAQKGYFRNPRLWLEQLFAETS